MREVNFAACLESESALESNGSGEFTRRAVAILASGMASMTHQQFQTRLVEAFGPSPLQHPYFDGGTGAGDRMLLAPLTNAAAPAAPTTQDILSRLDAIEARLSKLGA
jgi:hypothetical protein